MSKLHDGLAKLDGQPVKRGEPAATPRPLGRIVSAPAAEPADAGATQAPVSAGATARAAAEAPDTNPADTVNRRALRHIAVDRDALGRAGLLPPDSQARRLDDEYRQIKRPLLSNARGKRGVTVPRAHLIMVASALPGEGKSFTSINLAMSIAREKDWSVVLVDGDVAKPQITTLFGLDGEPGLLDILRSPTRRFDDCALPTDLPGLSILPAGARDDHAAELLASERMDALADELIEQDPARIVIFDSSPLLVNAESPVLASHVGQIVMVVRAGHTAQQRVQQAVAKVEDPNRFIGLVLNQAELGGGSMDGGLYGYGYGYGSGGGEPRQGEAQ